MQLLEKQEQRAIMEKNSTFGQQLRRWRKMADMSMEELAEASGFSKAYISRLERDLGNPTTGKAYQPSREFLVAVANAVGALQSDVLQAAGYAPLRTSALPPSGLIIGQDGVRREDGAALGEPDDDLLKQANAMIAKLTTRLAEKNQN